MRHRKTVDQWRAVVYRSASISDAVRVYLLRLSEHMKADLTVSVPRTQLARELNRHEQRIAERTRAAIAADLLDTISPGYKGHTAVYKAMFPDRVAAPKGTDLQYPKESLERYPITPDCVLDGEYTTSKRPPIGYAVGNVPDERRIYGEPGEFPGIGRAAIDGLPNEGIEERSA